MPFTVERYPGRDPWLAARRSGIGSSEALVVVEPELARGTSPYALWAEKSGLIDPEREQTAAMEWGTRLEPLIAQRFAEEVGQRVRWQRWTLFRDTARPWRLASPDVLVDGQQVGVECKAPGTRAAPHWANGVPRYYWVQVQDQLMVTGWDLWYVAALIGGQDFRVYEVERDDAFIAQLGDAVDRFWDRILDGRPPATDGTDATSAAIRALYPAPDAGKRVLLPPEALARHRQRLRAEERAKRWRRVAAKAQQDIELMTGDAEVGVLPQVGGEYRWTRRERDGYSVASTSWREFRFSMEES